MSNAVAGIPSCHYLAASTLGPSSTCAYFRPASHIPLAWPLAEVGPEFDIHTCASLSGACVMSIISSSSTPSALVTPGGLVAPAPAAAAVDARGGCSGDMHRSTTTGLFCWGLTEGGHAGAACELTFLTGLPEAYAWHRAIETQGCWMAQSSSGFCIVYRTQSPLMGN